MMNEPLRGHVHGIIIYRASHAKPHDRPWASNDELQSEHYARHIPSGPTQPLHFELPRLLPQVMTGSYYDRPDPLHAHQAAARLFSPRQGAFAMAADAAARHYAGIHPDQKHEHFTHLHGIGSWEGKMEPSMATVFHRPVSPVQLQKIAADVGSWARQEGVLAFVPHAGGVEDMLHLRFPSHSPLIKQLTPGIVAQISQRVTDQFNKHYDVTPQGVKEYLMPGRTILPDTEGHTDVMVWVPQFVGQAGRGRIHQAFQEIGHNLDGNIQYWSGTGKIIGGMHPYENSPREFSDPEKRAVAGANYHKALTMPSDTTRLYPDDVELPKYEPTEPQKLARSPAKTGIVIRGVYYAPGKIIPELISPRGDKPPAKMSADEFKAKLRVVYAAHRSKKHANDDSAGTGSNRQG